MKKSLSKLNKSHFIGILSILILTSCSNATFMKFGPDDKDKLVQINVDSTVSFLSLYKSIDEVVCNDHDSQVQLVIDTDSINYRLNLINMCGSTIVCTRSRNIIFILDDSIKKYDVGTFNYDSLSNLIQRDFSNNGIDRSLSENPSKVFLHFMQPQLLERVTLKRRLVSIIEEFRKTGFENEKLKLWVQLHPKEDPFTGKIPDEDELEEEIEKIFKSI
ncbi:hypothetical protein [Flammeovirga sp. SJP92]|uniref:hypothetical protein n=1 Tax=Flammeovirga sp. SJP92 TaxID=1775430 RepID=UPI000786AA9D|nr:hypothetical protein [Flammeovirga sp. SJP92]KXX70637.1 hypothetical protein AVL50_07390 [Flammeovirga sp. SJP92]